MKFTEEEEPITPLGQDWPEDEYYQTANAFFSSSTLAALASSNARAFMSKSAPTSRTTSPEPISQPVSTQLSLSTANSSSSSSLAVAPSASERIRLVETLMHTVAIAWDRYMALHQQSTSSFSDGDRSSPLPSFGLVVSDSDRSIVHVSAEFEMLTGYTRADALGRSAAFLQGKLTSDSAVTVLRSALREKRPCQVLLINYKKDGQPFWNLLTIAPSFSVDGTVDRWFGIQMVANESWRIDRPLPLFPWTQYPLPSIHPKKTKRAITPAPKASSRLLQKPSSTVVVEEIDEKAAHTPRAVPLSFIAETTLPTRHGRYRVRAYRQLDDSGNPTDVELMVIVHGKPELVQHDVPVRIHDACFTSEVIHSLKCDCREQLEYAMKYIRDAKDGVVIYLPQEGRGIGLSNKIKAYAMQELGLDTVDANRALGFPDDNRAYNAVPSILQDLQIKSVRLLSNNSRKFDVMRSLGVQINGRIPVLVLPTFVDEHGHADGIRLTAQVADGAPEYVKKDTKYAENYVKAKIARMNHMQYAQDI